jgi:hypothetical protein
VEVHTDYASHLCSSLWIMGAVGITTPTDPRSRRNRAGRGAASY